MAVALRDLERGHAHRRPALRIVPPQPSPPRPPPPVFWLRRALVVALAIVLMLGVVEVVRATVADTSVTERIEMTVVVPDGGTLWDLAERYAPAGADRSTWAAAVAERNDLDPGAIQPGTAVSVSVEAQHITASPQVPSRR